ncbi:heme/hemin ABC transporter substrate-binding protein [Pseudoclavibacter sp. CFCC 11306]|uniref:heme/hemin ABC transporter substrate-binding protein n=1 Tax=Pseudoclavibacter sp. CFCC 11306 TaxID=1564493 RepID=UPI001CE46E1F|nr:ABC transporter substrate-binding protein [Pseudoclavibacter sp. CFCC 11306]
MKVGSRRHGAGAVGPLMRVIGATVVALTLALSGCSVGSKATTSEQKAGEANLQPLSSLDTLSNPRNHFGESTATTAQTSITPIENDPQQQLPATVTDTQGASVTVTDTSRILALDLYGSLAATVFGLGLGDRVVGRDVSTGFPEAADLPLVTQNGHELNGEAILDLAPTVIVTDTTLGPWDTLMQMKDAGIPVVFVDSERNMGNVSEIVMQVASALGVPETGHRLSDRLSAEITAKTQEVAAIRPQNEADRVRMVFLYVRGNAGIYYMFGEGSGVDSLIDALGGVDVAREVGWKGMKPINAEALVQMKPDLILMMTKGLESVGGVDGLLERVPAVANTPAGQNRRVVDMSDTEIMSYGPRTADVLDALARAVYAPDASPAAGASDGPSRRDG